MPDVEMLGPLKALLPDTYLHKFDPLPESLIICNPAQLKVDCFASFASLLQGAHCLFRDERSGMTVSV